MRIHKFCSRCGREIPAGSVPNKEYVMLGMEFYHRPCYLQEIGLEAEA